MRNLSLKTKLTALTLGVAFALSLCSFLIMRKIANDQQKLVLKSFEDYSSMLENSISAQFFERYGDVQTFSINPSIRSSDRREIVETLNTYGALYGIYDLLMVVDAKGKLIAVNDKDPKGVGIHTEALYTKNYSEEEWFQKTLAGKTTDDAKKNFAGTFFEDVNVDPFVSEVYGGKRLGTSFSAPIKDASGKVIGVISNRAGARWFDQAFKEASELLKDLHLPNAEYMLINKKGMLVYHYGPNTGDKYDFDKILKIDFSKLNNAAATAALEGKSGATLLTENGEVMAYSYQNLETPKWISSIGWSILIRDRFDETVAAVVLAQKIFYWSFGIALLLAVVLSQYMSTAIANTISAIARSLSDGAQSLTGSSAGISSLSTQLSEASTEQAAAIQETAASIEEVSAMIKKNAQNAVQSQASSKKSFDMATDGKRSVDEMISAIGDISKSNQKIMDQVADGNRKISEIVDVISEIGNKTKVINDIVFQTKLLSFNASVEAARAGEHGKGFAVVAEEVGNLAQMSGNAAKEISALLETSLVKVNGIVEETKERVEKLIVEGKVNVEIGTKTAHRCGSALESILSTVQEVDGMVSEIATATREQSLGVEEINKAVSQLNQVTQQNSAAANQSAQSASDLLREANSVRESVESLAALVGGGGQKAAAVVVKAKPKAAVKTEVAKVVPIEARRPKATKPATPEARVAASAGRVDVPKANDPRFEDI